MMKIFTKYAALPLVLLLSTLAPAKEGSIYPSKVRHHELAEPISRAQLHLEFLRQIDAKMQAARIDEQILQKIREVAPEEKMSAMAAALSQSETRTAATKFLREAGERMEAAGIASGGSISGTVTVDGAPTFEQIQLFAFDEYGFFAGSATADGLGNYTIEGLPEGTFYVATESRFVNEFYNDAILDGFRNWRSAELIQVPENSAVTGIDIDLRVGATISGNVFMGDGITPLSFRQVTLDLFDADSPGPPHSVFPVTDADGAYEINVPRTGTLKIRASSFGFQSEFYNEKSDFLSADPVVVASLDDEITNISFSLAEGDEVEDPSGGFVAGTVLGGADTPIFLAFVFAFDVADTSFAGLGVSDFDGNYLIPGLDDGSYIVYANSFTGFLLPPVVSGQYYDHVRTSDLATPVAVAEDDTASGIDFDLDGGGTVAGTITDDTGAALDSIMVVAVKLDLLNINGFFFDSIDFGIGFSGEGGEYLVSGLSSGNYIMRTVSLVGPDLDIGPRFGSVLDEYYEDVQDLLDVANASPVAVTVLDTTTGINFELARAGGVAGSFLEFDGITPIQGEGAVIAFDADTHLPQLAFTEFDSTDGSFETRPLASGSYKLLGVVGLSLPGEGEGDGGGVSSVIKGFEAALAQAGGDEVVYLPQFYNLKASFDEADPVAVTAPTVTPGIDFTMIRAGSAKGRVNLSANFPVGADSLHETLVLAYDKTTGKVAGGADVTFAGGYYIGGLAPGDYRIAALTTVPGYAATYHGGSTTFDGATAVTVQPSQTVTADIDLATGDGIIMGTVTALDSGEPLTGILVLAYDLTGHAVSAGVSGPLPEGDLLPGEYIIPGLANGNFLVRTFSFFQILALLEGFGGGEELGGGDPLSLLLALLGSGDGLTDGLDIQLYGDLWYQDQQVEGEVDTLGIINLILSLLENEDPQVLVPFFADVPGGVSTVSVTSPGVAAGIDFALPRADNPITSVDDGDGLVPSRFALAQNYPNPFNPGTTIEYTIPDKAKISLQVFNMLGQRIRTLFEGQRDSGSYVARWNGLNDAGTEVAAGVYFLRMKSDDVVLSRRMLLLK